ncbi:hypothetical protein TNCV_2414311 [Trichonephila clavipes]|nr:hypothetical protein TNCV_2414311 [Trichonephila clavipes]
MRNKDHPCPSALRPKTEEEFIAELHRGLANLLYVTLPMKLDHTLHRDPQMMKGWDSKRIPLRDPKLASIDFCLPLGTAVSGGAGESVAGATLPTISPGNCNIPMGAACLKEFYLVQKIIRMIKEM